MRPVLMTREYPPEVYGGAGVHVEYLARELRALCDAEVRCFGADRADALAFRPSDELASTPNQALQVMSVDLAMAADLGGATLAHSHTWYANFAGHVAKLLHGIPHVLTTHSLEPSRPWKEEQLGGGYRLSSFCERTAIEAADAVIAVSRAMREDVLSAYPTLDPEKLHVILNGSTPSSTAPIRVPTCSSGSASVLTSRSWSSSAGSRGRRGSCTWRRRRSRSIPLRRSCWPPARPTRPRSRRRWSGASSARGPSAGTSSGSSRCSRRPR